jgi:WD40 repeat protein
MKRATAVFLVAVVSCVTCSAARTADKPGDETKKMNEPLPTHCVMRFGTSRFRHGIPISNMALSADGKLAVAVNGNAMLAATSVFDLVSGRVRYTFAGGEGIAIEAAAISPDGRWLVTKQDFSLRIRDADTGQELRTIELVHPNSSYSRNEWVTFTPNGKAIAVTSQGKVIHLFNFESGEKIRDFARDNPESSLKGFEEALGIAFSHDGKLLAAGGFDNDKGLYFARLLEVETGKELRRFMHTRYSYGIPSLALSPDGKMLATRSHDGCFRVFDVATGKLLREFASDGGGRKLGTVAFSPDSKTVAAAGDSIRLYDTTTWAERLRIDRKQASHLQFTDGGKTLTAAFSSAICRWDATTGKSLFPEGVDSPVAQIIVTADGRRVFTRGQGGDTHLWDAATGKHLRYVSEVGHGALAMSPDGRFFVFPVADDRLSFADPDVPNTRFDGHRLRLYEINSGRFVDRFPSFKGDANSLAFADDGKTLVTVDHRDGMVRLWDFETGKEQRSLRVVREGERKRLQNVWGTELSPDGKTLAVAYVFTRAERGSTRILELRGPGDETYPIRVWDVASGKELHQFDGASRYVQNMAISPDGQWLVSSASAFDNVDSEGELPVWSVRTGKTAATVPTGAGVVAFSGDGRYLATATPDGLIRLWETATWTLRREYRGHRDRPSVLKFCGNRPLLFSGSYDTTVLAWELPGPPPAKK